MFFKKFYNVPFSNNIIETIDPDLGYEGFYIEFGLLQNSIIDFILHKTEETQDCSIKFWFSKEPVGTNPLISSINNNNFNVINRPVKYRISTQPLTAQIIDYFPVILTPGDWYINFYNMLNVKNRIKILINSV
ncbi:MAG: hypothetical protein NZZ41_04110 [Candidatus Dojkabacteria bacterium]|nr:hypothetical protein [Candidatus Dojkabacteria bacterium]